MLIYQALGFQQPAFGHVSLILAPDRSKLSKRHGATSVGEFREQGFLPGAMANYLALLGWNDGTEQARAHRLPARTWVIDFRVDGLRGRELGRVPRARLPAGRHGHCLALFG